ncbi:hypothetical protein, partial [Methylobacterium haplocladii]|uniref:hypothetical protein n=1 Tax=Methylobacterium haplocladii TaxID=1176176 RepID=UPI001AEF13C6
FRKATQRVRRREVVEDRYVDKSQSRHLLFVAFPPHGRIFKAGARGALTDSARRPKPSSWRKKPISVRPCDAMIRREAGCGIKSFRAIRVPLRLRQSGPLAYKAPGITE